MGSAMALLQHKEVSRNFERHTNEGSDIAKAVSAAYRGAVHRRRQYRLRERVCGTDDERGWALRVWAT